MPWPAEASYKSVNVFFSNNLCYGWHLCPSPPKLPDFSHEDQIHHPHQHAMQHIRWERRAQFGSTRKKLKRNLKKSRQLSCTTALHRRLGRAPQSGPRSRFTDSWWRDCTSPPRQLPPKPWWRCPAPAKAMTQFSRKSLKVKVQWTWAPRPLPPSTMPSTIPLSQAAPHPIHPLIPSKQQSLNKSNICSLKQALEEYCSATIIVRISVFTQNLSTFASLQTIVLKTQGAVKRHVRKMSENDQISKCQLVTSKRCHLELQDAWTPSDKFCIDKAEKPSQLQRYWQIFYLSITKIFAGFYLKYFMRSSLPLVSRLVSCNIWSERGVVPPLSSHQIGFYSSSFQILTCDIICIWYWSISFSKSFNLYFFCMLDLSGTSIINLQE